MSKEGKTQPPAEAGRMIQTLSFRRLLEATRAFGSLSEDFQGPGDGRDGTLAHQRFYKRQMAEREADFYPEFALHYQYISAADDIELQLRGRLDLLLQTPTGDELYEVKSFRGRPDKLPDGGLELHWGQLYLYAAAYARQFPERVANLSLHLVYVSTESDQIVAFSQAYEAPRANDFMQACCERYLERIQNFVLWQERRNQAARTAKFPWAEVRPGQAEMMRSVLACLRDEDYLLLEAPTGIGKTLASLYPALKAQAVGQCEQIFYATAMTSTRLEVLKALDLLRERSRFMIRGLALCNKEQSCLCPDLYCNQRQCPYALDYYRRLADGLRDLFKFESIGLAELQKVGAEHRLCPHELALDFAPFADVVLGDYNHIFDPYARLGRFFAQERKIALLLDEAHNLPSRARTMLTAVLESSKVQHCLQLLSAEDPILQAHPLAQRLRQALHKLYALLRWGRSLFAGVAIAEDDPARLLDPTLDPTRDLFHKQEQRSAYQCTADFWACIEKPDRLLALVGQINFLWGQLFEELEDFPGIRDCREFWFDLLRLTRCAEQFYAGNFLTAARPAGGEDIDIYLLCLDAAEYLAAQYKGQHPTVFFSATLSPLAYYKVLLGLQDEPKALTEQLASPFPPENRLILTVKDFDMSYQGRGQAIPELLEAIFAIAREKIGNYLIFCPSFAYLSQLRAYLKQAERPADLDFMLQVPRMSDKQKRFFLERFNQYGQRSLLAFAVLGSLFNEGIDLKGERLSGVMILGTGLPGLSPERNLLGQYYAEKLGNAFLYAYLYPGFNRVQQALGRLIRSEADQGIVVLFDRRWRRDDYRPLLPEAWRCRHPEDMDSALELIADFWAEHQADISDEQER